MGASEHFSKAASTRRLNANRFWPGYPGEKPHPEPKGSGLPHSESLSQLRRAPSNSWSNSLTNSVDKPPIGSISSVDALSPETNIYIWIRSSCCCCQVAEGCVLRHICTATSGNLNAFFFNIPRGMGPQQEKNPNSSWLLGRVWGVHVFFWVN